MCLSFTLAARTLALHIARGGGVLGVLTVALTAFLRL